VPIDGTLLSCNGDRIGLDVGTTEVGSNKPLSKLENSKLGVTIGDEVLLIDGDNIGWDFGTSEGVSNKQLSKLNEPTLCIILGIPIGDRLGSLDGELVDSSVGCDDEASEDTDNKSIL